MIDSVTVVDPWSLFFLPALLFGAALSLLWLIVLLPATLIWLWLLARICRKAGFSGWWSLSTFFPPLFAGLIWLLAFSDWPGRPRIQILPPGR